MLVEAPNRARSSNSPLAGLRGLRDTFSSSVQYTPNSNVLDIGVDNSLQNRVSAIVSSGIVGAFNGYNVYNESATGQIFADIGMAYPRLQQIVPSQTATLAPPTGGDCPCDAANCKEEIFQETYWASPTKTSESDIEVAMQREITVCEPVDAAPTLACADELAQFKAANGINGLRGLGLTYTAAQKKCIDGCSGLPQDQWNKCMDKCRTTTDQPIAALTAAWKDCYTGCNSKKLSQADLQRCYASCGTGTAVSPSGQLVAYPSRNQQFGLVSAMNGLSNDNSIVEEDDTTTYVTDPRIVLSQPVDCEKNSNRALWFVVCVAGGIVIGILSALAWKKR